MHTCEPIRNKKRESRNICLYLNIYVPYIVCPAEGSPSLCELVQRERTVNFHFIIFAFEASL